MNHLGGLPRQTLRNSRRWRKLRNGRRWRPRSAGWGARAFFLGLGLLGVMVVGFLLALVVTAYNAYAYFTRDLSPPERLSQRQVFQSAFIYDRRGELLYELYDRQGGRRIWVPVQEVSPLLVDATLATEDPNFWGNPGFDPLAIGRAAWQNWRQGRITSGASTITQQLVKNALFDPKERYDQSYRRKIKEALLAYEVAQVYSKDEILEMYLNEVYYGNLAYGIGAAAFSYFGKHPRDLTLAEAAVLAGLPQAPNYYNPLTNLPAAKARQAYVLDRMVTVGYLTEEEATAALRQPLNFNTDQTPTIEAPHLVWFVRDLLERRYGREKLYYGGLRVYTSLDLGLQHLAEKIAREHIDKIKAQKANNAAVVALNPKTGEILAMVGSVDYWEASIDGQVNMAVAERQPGSAIKPFTYATAFARGYTPATVVVDQPMAFPQGPGLPLWAPQNHDKKFRGPITLRQALAPSLNLPAVLVLQEVGVPAMLETAHRLGIATLSDPRRYGLAVTLGGGEVKLLDMAFAYAAFANDGRQGGALLPQDERRPGMSDYAPVAILKITDWRGNVLYEHSPPPPRQVLAPEIAYLITDILSDDEARAPTYGRRSALVIDRPAVAKTGTTDNYKDGWTMGYTPDLVVGVWTGNSDNTPMLSVFGAAGAGVIWHNFMIEAHKYLGLPPKAFPVPAGIVRGLVCGQTEIWLKGVTARCQLGPQEAPEPAPAAGQP